MPGTGAHLPGFVESTLRFCSVVTDWFCRLIPDPLKSPSSISRSKLTKKRKLYSSALWDKMEAETINISSSDSDFDMIDEYAEISSSSDDESAPVPTGRVLPNWRPVSHSTGVQNQHPRPPLPIGGPSSSRGTSSLRGHQLPGPSTSYGTDRRASSSNVFRGSEENGGTSHSRRDYENGLQLQKRALPPSFNLSAGARSRQNSSWDNLGGHRGGDNSGSYHSAGPSVSNPKNSGRGSFNRNWENDVHLFDRNELHNSRILPQSMTRGKPGSSTPYGSPSDPLQNMGYAEERVAGDERLIFQAALQDLSQPKIELDLPIGVLTIPLLRHQKIALAWMVQKESRTMHCLGGILADDQGLGKTISTIALIQKQRSLQMKFQSEENDNHNAEALNLDDDDDDDKGSGSLKASNKTEGVGSDKPETLNLDDDDDDGSAGSNAVKKAEEPAGSQRGSDAGSSCQKFQRQRPAAGTLIVCPATVLRQWARELDDKVSEEAKLSVLVYHGGNRTKDPVELAKYDVVLTTYSIVSNEVPKQPIVDEDDVDQKLAEKYGVSPEFSANKKRKNPSGSKKGKKGKLLADSLFSQSGALARVSWFRVVLDEAQTIKNHRTQTARACCGLRAKRRWCLSGTPIQNSIDEVYSYFRYLRHHLYSNYKTFCEGIKYPISRDPNMGYKKLQAVLKTLLLRRTKETLLDGEPIISLPPKHVVMKRVNFSSEERTFYAQLEAESRSQFKAYAAAGTVNQNYANILLMILRLRQACDHPLLVKGFCSVSGSRTNLDKARKLPRNLLMELLNQLEAASAICLICSDPPEDAVISTCRHVFCYQCVADYLTGDDNMCPARRCKKQLSDDVLFSEVTLRSCLSTDADGNLLNNDGSAKNTSILSSEYSSSKVKAAMEILLSHCELNASYIELDGLDGLGTENSMHAQVRTHKMEGYSSSGPIKTIVFSQWTRMLDLFEFALNQYCIQYRRLDGSMSLVARDRAVRDFNSDPEVTVMLMSLKAGNLGLNMVAASHVILLDLWWNPTTEDQAVDRAHRIGQTRAVTVSRITIKDTVEDRILALQEEKRKMVASAFGEDHVGGTASRLTVDDLRYLFLGSRAA